MQAFFVGFIRTIKRTNTGCACCVHIQPAAKSNGARLFFWVAWLAILTRRRYFMEASSTATPGAAEADRSKITEMIEVLDDRRSLELRNSIVYETVEPIIIALESAAPAEKLRIYIRANNGGKIAELIRLVQALARTQADVELCIGRYAMSCAAVLWLWFAFDPIEGDDGVGRVASIDPIKPAIILYHRPRWPYVDDQKYHCFIDDFEDAAVRESLKEQVDLFDALFERLLAAQGLSQVQTASRKEGGATYTHHLYFARSTYYNNGDYVVPVTGVES